MPLRSQRDRQARHMGGMMSPPHQVTRLPRTLPQNRENLTLDLIEFERRTRMLMSLLVIDWKRYQANFTSSLF